MARVDSPPRPEPGLSAREIAALAALAEQDSPATGHGLAARMQMAGRPTTTAAAHQAGAALARKGLAIKGQPDGDPHAHVRYEITCRGRDWIASYQGGGSAVIVREPDSAVLVSPVGPEDAGNVRCAEHPDARILEERSPAGTGDTYLYCPWHSARGLVIGGRGYLARYEFRKAAGRA